MQIALPAMLYTHQSYPMNILVKSKINVSIDVSQTVGTMQFIIDKLRVKRFIYLVPSYCYICM